MLWLWCLDAYLTFIVKLLFLIQRLQHRAVEITTVTITQPCQWNCFAFGYQSNRCHSLAVHKKELTLLYHTFSPENAWCLLKLYKDLWLGYIHDMSPSIWMTTALVLQPPALHWCCWSSNDCITDQKHSRTGSSDPPGSSPRDAQNSWKIPLLPLNMTRQAVGQPFHLRQCKGKQLQEPQHRSVVMAPSASEAQGTCSLL